MVSNSSGEVRLFRETDYDDFTLKLKKVVDRARAVENERVEPTLKDRAHMSALLLDFIKQRGRIVYGGYAINKLIHMKSKEDAFYDFSSEAPDIEFYTSDAVVDAKDLCDMFHAKGYLYVRGTEAFHAETYKVSVNLNQICDITYVPKNIQRAIPHVVIDGIKYAHPHFLLIDSIRIITDPVTSYWRLDKAFPRIYALQKHYPLSRPEGHDSNMRNRVENVQVTQVIETALKFFKEDLTEDEVAIMIGYAAFDRFAQWSQNVTEVEKKKIPFLEVVVTDYAKTVPRLFKLLREAHGDEVKYEEFQRFFDYCGHRGHIYIGGHLAICIFHHNNRCTPILSMADDGVESETLRTATMSVTALYILISKMLCRTAVPPNLRGQSVCDSLIFELYSMRTAYLEATKKDVVGDHPFQEFTSVCAGTSIATLRAHKEETLYRRSRPGQFGMAYFSYEPSQALKYDIADYKYMNSSGNSIRSSADRLFTPEAGLVEAAETPESYNKVNKVNKVKDLNKKSHNNKYRHKSPGGGRRRRKSPPR